MLVRAWGFKSPLSDINEKARKTVFDRVSGPFFVPEARWPFSTTRPSETQRNPPPCCNTFRSSPYCRHPRSKTGFARLRGIPGRGFTPSLSATSAELQQNNSELTKEGQTIRIQEIVQNQRQTAE